MLHSFNPEKELVNLKSILEKNEQIKFVSLISVDLANHHTDEKIPMELFKEDIDGFLKNGIQTDGSSVYLPGIADINNAKVDIIPDLTVKWFVDYNYDNYDELSGLPIGTLLIPAFLKHEENYVCSRSLLKLSVENLEKYLLELINNNEDIKEELSIDSNVSKVVLTLATELEFWVNSPKNNVDVQELSASQTLKEQYWKRTIGSVRTALEKSLDILQLNGFEPEMGHKEVGGVSSKLNGLNQFSEIMEQIEIDWKYDKATQSADNEMFIKDIIFDVFTSLGLEVSFKAKPIEGVAGSGEHHHFGIMLILSNGKKINLFSPKDMKSQFLNRFGYSALMGVLKNYSLINPFISNTNDAFNRLKPGFEAPVCTVTSLGHTYESPSRNRTILIGLVRDIHNTYSTRFELRSPNPSSNTYLTTSAISQAMIDSFDFNIKTHNRNTEHLEKELSKSFGENGLYLENDRMYRSEEDVFEEYDSSQRDKYFGVAPRTVWENIKSLKTKDTSFLLNNGIFSNEILNSYYESIKAQWITELDERIVLNNIDLLRSLLPLHNNDINNELDIIRWDKISRIKTLIMKDTIQEKSLFSQLHEAIEKEKFDEVSAIQIVINEKISEIKILYKEYKRNIINI
jgi:glutamine synthetase